MAEITRAHIDRHVNSRLRTRIRLYLGISILIVLAIAYRIWQDGGGILYPAAALAIGIVVGSLVSRMFNVSWDAQAEQVVSRIDTYGGALLIVYVIFEITGEHFIRQWFVGPEVLTIILALAGGAVLGRGIGMGRKMMQVLRANV